MWQLNKVVVPRIKAYWEDVAYSLHYDIHDVEGIRTTHKDDAKNVARGCL